MNTLRLNTTVCLEAGVKKKYRRMITGTSIAASGVAIIIKVRPGRMTSMKLVPSGGKGIAAAGEDVSAMVVSVRVGGEQPREKEKKSMKQKSRDYKELRELRVHLCLRER